ncbi:MAG: pathogenicity locus [Actinobacteria bacterium]|nr:pathogenicity locus [Actinomycetota bacterium]
MAKLPPYRRLEDLPGVGKAVADDYRRLGVVDAAAVATHDPFRLYEQLQAIDGPTDVCMLYTFRCAHYAASTPDPDVDLLAWWVWKDR